MVKDCKNGKIAVEFKSKRCCPYSELREALMAMKKFFDSFKSKEIFTNIVKTHLVYMLLRLPLAFGTSIVMFLGIGWLQVISFKHFGYDFHWAFIVVRIVFAFGIVALSYLEIKNKDNKWKCYVLYLLYFIVTAFDMIALHTLSMVANQ